MAAEYEVNIKINSQEIERELGKIDRTVAKIGKPKGGGSRRKPGIAGLLPSSEELRAAEKGIVQLAAKTKNIQSVQDKFSERRTRALIRSNVLNEKELRINKQLTAEARTRLRLLSQAAAKGFDKTRPQGRQMADNINALTNAQEKRARLANKLNEMEAKGLNVQKLREKLGKATTEQSARRFASAEKEFRLLAKSIRLEESKLRILKQQQQGFPSSPVRGTRTMMGSPAQIAAAGPQIASPIRGSISMPGSPIAVQAAKATNLRALKVEASWVKALGELEETAGMLKMKDTRIKQSWSTALAELNETAALLQVRSQQANAGLTGQSSPIGGATNIPGSPAFLRRQQRIKTLEQVGLGAGFPLLFGGGAGSVLGGGLGGLTGSFGAQIAFSAIGQQIDKFVASMVNAGKALTSVGGAADFMAEKSLFSSDAMQFRIEKLIEEGQVAEAAALMTKEMAKQVGGSGLKALKDLGTEASKMGKLFSALILQIQAFIAKGLTPLLKAINTVVGNLTLNNQFNALMKDATGDRAKEINEFLKPFTTKISGQGGKNIRTRISQEGKRLAVEKFGGQFIPEGAAIEPTELERLRAADSGGGKAGREEERLQKRLGKLEEERKKVLEISRFRDRIAAAEAAEDDELVIRLQGEQRIAEIEASRLNALVGVADQREIEAINIGKATEKLAAHRDTERELTKLQLQRQEKFEDTIENLEHQLKLAQATSEEERERLRIEKELQELREGGMSESQLGQVGDLMRQISAENSPLNQFIKQSVESLNNLEQHAVQVSQGIGNAIGNSLVNGMQNLITGAASVKQVFADMLKSIADVLAKQAAQMIATYIAIGIARAFAGLGSKGSGTTPPTTLPGAASQTGLGLNINGVDQGISPFGPNIVAAASGAYVSGPTRALVGEGGQGEYIIPESKMRESMARYSRGARGSAVIPENGGGSGAMSEGGGTAVAAPIDVRYTVERINSVDYVTADQFQAGMRQAANQGAKQGEQQTLKRLQMSSSTRKRVGM